jgi:inosose dehydratase
MILTRREMLKSSTGALAAAAIGGVSCAGSQCPIKFGLTTNTRPAWNEDFLLAISEASEVGFKAVETFNSYIREYRDDPAALKALLDERGLVFVTISNGGGMKGNYGIEAERDQLIEDHVALVKYLKHFGCTHLKVNTGRREESGTTLETLKIMAKTANELGKRIVDEGLEFGVHPHVWSHLETGWEVDTFFELADPRYVKMVLDTGQIAMGGADPIAMTRKYIDRMVEFHLKDVRPEHANGRQGPPLTKELYGNYEEHQIYFALGDGGVNFPELFRIMEDAGFNGWATVEQDHTTAGCKIDAARSFAYIRDVLGYDPTFIGGT